MATFIKGQAVKYKTSNDSFRDNTKIITVLDKQPEEDQIYIVENEYGWVTDATRKERFGLEDNKKYMFVKEKELIAV
jgi:hypothetical protein